MLLQRQNIESTTGGNSLLPIVIACKSLDDAGALEEYKDMKCALGNLHLLRLFPMQTLNENSKSCIDLNPASMPQALLG